MIEVPYTDRVPPKARVGKWHVRDVNGLILVWHHLNGQPPQWDIPALAELGADDWAPYDHRRWKIRSHNQEMAENAVDSAHVHYVSGTVAMPTSNAHVDGASLRVVSDTRMKIPMGKVEGQVESVSHGFGYALTRFTGLVETLLVAGVTPIDDEYVDVRFAFTSKKLPSGEATSTVGSASANLLGVGFNDLFSRCVRRDFGRLCRLGASARSYALAS